MSSTLFVCGGAGFILLDKVGGWWAWPQHTNSSISVSSPAVFVTPAQAAKKEGKAQGFFTIAGLSASLIAYVGVRAFIGIKVCSGAGQTGRYRRSNLPPPTRAPRSGPGLPHVVSAVCLD